MPPSAIPGHTAGHVDCPLCESRRKKHLNEADFGLLYFRDAAPFWLAERKPELSEGSIHNYEQHLHWLSEFFGDMPLNEVEIIHVEAYQEWRQQPRWDEKARRTFRAGYSPINHEISALQQILATAGLWTEIEKFYRPLKQPKTRAGRALEPEEQQRLFATAWSNPYWQVAYCAALTTINTSATSSEIRHLHLGDIDLRRSILTIRDGLKNEHRDRIEYLNATAAAALKRLLDRAHRLGCSDPEHFLLPHRAHRKGAPADPNRPMGSFKRAWQSMRKAAGLPQVRYHDLRHHIITVLLENPEISEQTVEEIVGHVPGRMKKRYSHIRMQRKKEALNATEVQAPVPQLEFGFEPLRFPPRKMPEPVRTKAKKREAGLP